jgi:hypothetical protein
LIFATFGGIFHSVFYQFSNIFTDETNSSQYPYEVLGHFGPFLPEPSFVVSYIHPVIFMKQPDFSLPPMPTKPTLVLFDNELSARRALFAIFDRARKGVSYQMQWSEGQQATNRQTGTEVFHYLPDKPDAKKAMLEINTGNAGTRTLRRAIADGSFILGTLFQEAPKRPTVREFSRLAMELTPTLRESLTQVGVMPRSALGTMALERRFRVRGSLWQTPDGVIYSSELRDNLTIVRCFTKDKNQTLLKYEEWTQRTGDKTPRYRREDYLPAPRITADTFSQNLPSKYTEKKITGRDIAPTLPLQADPRALALWEMWRQASERFLTLEADVQSTLNFEAANPEADQATNQPRRQNSFSGTYQIALYRPYRAFISYKTLEGSNRNNRNDEWSIVSDGTQAQNRQSTQKNKINTKINNGEDLWNALARVGAQDNLRVLRNLLDGPQDLAGGDILTYGGKQPLTEGGMVESITLVHKESDRYQDRPAETMTEARIFLGSDHPSAVMPIEIQYTRRTNVESLRPRDQPPVMRINVRYAPQKIDIPLRLSQFSI